MNQIFRVIWNQSTQTWVAVSELARGRVKSSTDSSSVAINSVNKNLFGGMSAIVALLASLPAFSADGGTVTSSTSYLDAANLGTPNNLGLGGVVHTYRLAGVAVGPNSIAFNQGGVGVGANSTASGAGSVALGAGANSSALSSISLGLTTLASGSNSLAVMRQAGATGDYSMAIGTAASVSGQSGIGIGKSVLTTGTRAIAIGAATNTNAVYDATTNAQATGTDSIALGTTARATNTNTTAIGVNAAASQVNAMAIGVNATASQMDATAIGANATASHQRTVAIGLNSSASYMNATAIGSLSKATKEDAIAIGALANTTGNSAIGIGKDTISSGQNSIALGNGADAVANNAFAVVAYSNANASNATAIGYSSDATAENATAIGANANAALAGSLALGNNSITGTSVPATTLSYNFANDAGSTVAASAQKDKANSVVSVGNGTYQRKIINLAAGAVTATSTEAINGSQLYNVVTNVGFNIQENGTAKSRINNNNIINFANGTYTTASVTDGANSSKVVFNVVNQAITSANGVAAVSGTTAGLATAADVVNAVNNTGFNLQANGATNSFIKSGDTVNFKQGDNILVTKSGNNITVATSMTPTFTMLTTTGDATIGGNLDMTSGKITNLANGTNPNDAVNLQQLNATAALANRPLTFTGNTGTTEQQLGSTLNISGDASTSGTYSSANVKTVVTQDKVEIQIAESPTFTSVDTGSLNATGDVSVGGSLTASAASINGDLLVTGETVFRGGITVDGAQTVDMGGNKVNNVEAGTEDTDAVNVSQLKANTTKVVAGKNTTVTNTTGADGTTYTINADDTSASVSTDSSLLTVAANGSKTVGNATVTDYKVSLSQGTLATNNGVVSSTTNGVATTQDVANAINEGYWKVGNNAGTETAQIKFGDQVNFVNGSGTLSNVTGANVSFDVNVDGKTINVGSDGKLTVNTSALPKGVSVEAGNHTTVTSSAGTNGETVYTVDAEKTTASAGSSAVTVTAGTKNASGVTDYAVDLSQTTKDQLAKADTAIQNFTTSVNGATVETITKDNNDVGFVNGTGTTARNDNGNITFDIKTTNLTTTDGNVTAGDTGNSFATAGDVANAINNASKAAKTEVKEGENIKVSSEMGTNGQTVYTVATSKDLVVNTITAGDTVLNSTGLTINNGPSITTSGIDAADNKITNVTNGTVSADSQDAVNGSQLYSVQTVADSALQTFTTSVNGVNVETISKDNNDVGFVNGTGTTARNDNGNITFDIKTTNLTTTDGNVTAGDTGNSFATAGDVANAINNASKAAKTEVKEGENIKVSSETGANGQTVYTVATSKDLVVNTITAGDTVLNSNQDHELNHDRW